MKKLEATNINNLQENNSDYSRSHSVCEKRIFPLYTNFEFHVFSKGLDEPWRSYSNRSIKSYLIMVFEKKLLVISRDIALEEHGGFGHT